LVNESATNDLFTVILEVLDEAGAARACKAAEANMKSEVFIVL
jgi:hypothetical protein